MFSSLKRIVGILSEYTKDTLAIIRQVGIQGYVSDQIIDGFKIYLSGCLSIIFFFFKRGLIIILDFFFVVCRP